MTQHKHLKNRVRTRMQKTGERYAAALRHVRAQRPEEQDGTAGTPAGALVEEAAGTPAVLPLQESAGTPQESAGTPQESAGTPAGGTAGTPAGALVEEAAGTPAVLPPQESAGTPAGAPAAPAEDASQPPFSDAAIRAATGRGWEEWFAWLDGAGAAQMRHPEIARLVHAAGASGWWSQSVTVGYERARGLRAKHQRAGGFSADASKTVRVPLSVVYAACADDASRSRWLVPPPGASYTVRGTTRDKSVRLIWSDGTPVTIGFYAKDPSQPKVQVGVQHDKLPDAEAVARLKAFWKESLGRLAKEVAG